MWLAWEAGEFLMLRKGKIKRGDLCSSLRAWRQKVDKGVLSQALRKGKNWGAGTAIRAVFAGRRRSPGKGGGKGEMGRAATLVLARRKRARTGF